MHLRCDLHNHSCLSPCGSLDLSPSALAHLARERGLDVVALTDHHTARNTPAFAKACRREGLIGVYGMEIATVEEIHCVALFSTPDAAIAFEEDILHPHLPPFPNNPEKLGDQPIVDADDNILDIMPNFLGVASDIPFSALPPMIENAGGVFWPAHVDRPAFSVLSQLGLIPISSGPILELSRHATPQQAADLRRSHTLIASSDAHYPENVAAAWALVDAPDRSWPAVFSAIRSNNVLALHPLGPLP